MSVPTSSRSVATQGNAPVPGEPTDLRSKVVQIISATANGCLSELGYFPGLPQRLQQAEECNIKWQNENLKLYQDNRKLSQLLEQQNQRLKFVDAPDATKLATIEQLQAQIHALTAERTDLLRKNDALAAHSPIDVAYQKLSGNYQNLLEMYRIAWNELMYLKNQIPSSYIATQVPQAQADHTMTRHSSSNSMVPSHGLPIQRRVSDAQMEQIRQDAPMASLTPPSHDQLHRPQNQQYRSAEFEKPTQIVTNTNHRVEGPFPSSSQNHSQLNWVKGWQPPNSQMPHVHVPESYRRPASNPVPPNAGTASSGPSRPINTKTHTPLVAISSTGPPQQDMSSIPNPPILQSHSQFQQQHHHGHRQQPPQSLTQSQSRPTHITPAVFSQDQHPAPTSPTSHKSVSPIESVEAITPIDTTRGYVDGSAAYVQVTVHDVNSLKRSNGDMMDFASEDPHKRQRLDNGPLECHKEPLPMEYRKPEAFDRDKEGEDGGEDEIVAVDADGLRIVEDCVAALIDDENNEELQTCRLCVARYEMSVTTEPPKPFFRATMTELASHCSTEHPDAWEALRQNVGG